MQIYDALKKDHEKVKQLFTELLSLNEEDEHHLDLVEQIRDELVPHSRAEEKVFYNSLREVDADSAKVMHSYGEHIAAEGLLRTLQAKEKVNLDWKTTAKKLQEALDHHIAEEESNLFAIGRAMFTDEEAEKMGAAFEALKPKIKSEGFMKTTADMVANLMPPKFQKSNLKKDSSINR